MKKESSAAGFFVCGKPGFFRSAVASEYHFCKNRNFSSSSPEEKEALPEMLAFRRHSVHREPNEMDFPHCWQWMCLTAGCCKSLYSMRPSRIHPFTLKSGMLNSFATFCHVVFPDKFFYLRKKDAFFTGGTDFFCVFARKIAAALPACSEAAVKQ